MPTKTLDQQIDEKITAIGAHAAKSDGVVSDLAKGVTDALDIISKLVKGKGMPLPEEEGMEEGAPEEPEVEPEAEGDAQDVEDFEEEGQEDEAGAEDMRLAREIELMNEGDSLDVTPFVRKLGEHQVHYSKELRKARKENGVLRRNQALLNDKLDKLTSLVGAGLGLQAAMAKGVVDTTSMLESIPAGSAFAVGHRGALAKLAPQADKPRGAGDLSTTDLYKGRKAGLLTDGDVRHYKKFLEFTDNKADNDAVTAKIKALD